MHTRVYDKTFRLTFFQDLQSSVETVFEALQLCVVKNILWNMNANNYENRSIVDGVI